jgi:3',5'-cyclic AMP phosphodiesterase CpdA
MRSLVGAVVSLLILVSSAVVPCGAESSADKNVSLRFDGDGRFKIVQFTDLHLKEDSEDDDKTVALMGEVLDVERPQLVVVTGDVLAGSQQPEAMMKRCAGPMVERQIPWTVALGNHDDEGTRDRRGLMDIIMSLPYAVSQQGSRDITGVSNYYLPVLSADGQEKQWILYVLDSNAYPPEKSLGTYDWIHTDQVDWYRRTSRKLAGENGGRPYPALAFFHIPLPEYDQVLAAADANLAGYRYEKVCCPDINSGFFAAMLECGDVKGTFVGHDHVNDYEATLHGIRLIYGRGSGFNAYGREGFPRGGRVILLEADKDTFATWLRLESGVKVQY